MPVSADTQALLLLTASLQRPGHTEWAKPLTPVREWQRLRRVLKDSSLRPADLFSESRRDILAGTSLQSRVKKLLERDFDLANALDRWECQGLWIMSYLDNDYPRRLKETLKNRCPPLFFGCGDRALPNSGGLAVVGSRYAPNEDLEFARKIGSAAAEKGVTVISGGALGVDRAAMEGALNRNGGAVGVLVSVRSHTLIKSRWDLVESGMLTFISETSPDEEVSRRARIGKLMQRNKYIYCLSDAALVVRSGTKGGTWGGAIENLEKGRGSRASRRWRAPSSRREANKNLKKGWVPLLVYDKGDSNVVNAALIEKGGKALSEKETPLDHVQQISSVLAGRPEEQSAKTQQISAEMREAVLLLTAQLPEDTDSHKPLNYQEWGNFAKWLNKRKHTPADLLDGQRGTILQDYSGAGVLGRVLELLNRRDSLQRAIARWEEAGVWYMTRGDEDYPKALKKLLRHESPAVLFGCGDKSLLSRSKVAVVGSRRATKEYADYSEAFGKAAGEENVTLLARGTGAIAESAVAEVLEAGGEAVAVLAGDLLKAAQDARLTGAIQEGTLIMVSGISPDAKACLEGSAESKWHNDILCCFSDAVLVVRAGHAGETMESADEILRDGRTPVWVRPAAGNSGLIRKGGIPLSDHNPWEQIQQILGERPDPPGGIFPL